MVTTFQERFDNEITQDDFRELLETERESALREGKRTRAFLCRRALNRRRIFNRTYDRTSEKFEEWMSVNHAEISAVAMGDGELFKYFLDWLKDGGWEIIAEIIKMFF